MKLTKAILTAFILLCLVNANAQTTDEIIDNHVKAIGGKEAWKKVNTIKQEPHCQNNSIQK